MHGTENFSNMQCNERDDTRQKEIRNTRGTERYDTRQKNDSIYATTVLKKMGARRE